MKQKKLIIALSILLVVLIGALAAVMMYNPESKNKENEPIISQFVNYETTDKMIVVDIKNESGAYTISNKGGGDTTIMDTDENLVDKEKIDVFLESIKVVRSSDTAKTDVPKENINDYGMEKPLAKVAILDDAEAGILFSIGTMAADGENYYMYAEGGKDIYLIDAAFAELFFQPKSNFLKIDFYPSMAEENIKDIEWIEAKAGETQSYRLERTRVSEMANLIYFDMVSPVKITTGRENVESVLLSKLQALSGTDVVSQNAEEDLGKYGLTTPSYTLAMGYKKGEYTITFGNSENGYTYARVAGDNRIYTVADEKTAFLQLDYMDIMGDSVFKRNITTISNITLNIRGEQHSYDVEGEATTLKASENGTEKDLNAFMELFGQLNAIHMEGEVKEAQGDAIFTMEVRYRDDTNPTEVIAFIPMDERKCAISVNGNVAFYTYLTTVDKIKGFVDGMK